MHISNSKLRFLCCLYLQLFPNLDKVVFLDDDIVIQRDLSPLWDIDLSGKVNGAVETCKGEDEWVMSKRFRNYFNFSHPLIAKNLNPENCAWAYGMNIFDLRAWRKTNITNTYHAWLKEVLNLMLCDYLGKQLVYLNSSSCVFAFWILPVL